MAKHHLQYFYKSILLMKLPVEHMIIIFILTVMLMGCEHQYTPHYSEKYPIEYMYTTRSCRHIFTKADLKANPKFGVAILGEDGPRGTGYVACGLRDFVQSEAKADVLPERLITNIGSDIDLNFNGKVINADYILKKFPGMRYALYFRESDRDVEKDSYSQTRKLIRESDGKEIILYDDVYKTTITVEAEIVLFDLVDNTLLAKAFETFSVSKTRIKKDKETENSFVDHLVSALFDIVTSDSNYPDITISDIERQYTFFTYHFLKKIRYESRSTVQSSNIFSPVADRATLATASIASASYFSSAAFN